MIKVEFIDQALDTLEKSYKKFHDTFRNLEDEFRSSNEKIKDLEGVSENDEINQLKKSLLFFKTQQIEMNLSLLKKTQLLELIILIDKIKKEAQLKILQIEQKANLLINELSEKLNNNQISKIMHHNGLEEIEQDAKENILAIQNYYVSTLNENETYYTKKIIECNLASVN